MFPNWWLLNFWKQLRNPNLFCKEVKSKWNSYLSLSSCGPDYRVVCFSDMLASGWGSLWESSSFVHWFVPSVFRDISGADPEWTWTSGLKINSSSREGAPKVRLLGPMFCYSTLNFLKKLKDIIFLWSGNCCVFYQVSPRMLHTIFLVQSCKFLPVSQSCHFLQEKTEQSLRLNYQFMKEFNSLIRIMFLVRKKNEKRLIITVSNIHKICVSYFHFTPFLPLTWQEKHFFTRQVKVLYK